MFEFLFKYPLTAFQQGTLVLLGVWPHWLLPVLIAIAAAGLALFLRARVRNYLTHFMPLRSFEALTRRAGEINRERSPKKSSVAKTTSDPSRG